MRIYNSGRKNLCARALVADNRPRFIALRLQINLRAKSHPAPPFLSSISKLNLYPWKQQKRLFIRIKKAPTCKCGCIQLHHSARWPIPVEIPAQHAFPPRRELDLASRIVQPCGCTQLTSGKHDPQP